MLSPKNWTGSPKKYLRVSCEEVSRGVEFSDGTVQSIAGSPLPVPRFEENGDGTVTAILLSRILFLRESNHLKVRL